MVDSARKKYKWWQFESTGHSQGFILVNNLCSKTYKNYISLNPAYTNAHLKDTEYIIRLTNGGSSSSDEFGSGFGSCARGDPTRLPRSTVPEAACSCTYQLLTEAPTSWPAKISRGFKHPRACWLQAETLFRNGSIRNGSTPYVQKGIELLSYLIQLLNWSRELTSRIEVLVKAKHDFYGEKWQEVVSPHITLRGWLTTSFEWVLPHACGATFVVSDPHSYKPQRRTEKGASTAQKGTPPL